jgi:hypothetical protein
MGHRPNARRVAAAWANGVAGIAPPKDPTTLPRDKTLWAAAGFVQVGPVVGGAPDIHVEQRHTIVEIGTWAVNLNSVKPPWGKANTLAELVIRGCYDPRGGGRDVSGLLPAGFDGARVQTVYPTSEPREFSPTENTAALYKFELAINWTALA